MPGTATGFPSGRFGRAGKRGGMRMMVAGIARLEIRPIRYATDGVDSSGATFNSTYKQVKQRWLISGITKNSTGTPLPGCAVHIFNTQGDTLVAETLSDASGNYSVSVDGNASARYCVAYLAGSPDVAGTTVNTLIATLT